MSDFISNTARGIFAEFVIARALGISTEGVREPWAAQDLVSPTGVRIEVKSAAYLQAWAQKSLSKISFSVKRSRTWSADTNELSPEPCRPSDVYVFALLAHPEKATLNPLDLDQWRFYVLPTEHFAPQMQSVSLKYLESIGAGPHQYSALKARVEEVARRPLGTCGA